MKRATLFALVLAATCGLAQAQVAGSTLTATATLQVREVAQGWSVRRQVLGREVVNEHGQHVGRVDDIIVAPDTSVSHAIIGTPGGFLGLNRHVVAVPVSQMLPAQDKFILMGARPGTIEQMPVFEYAQ
jgi:sporulation protein YlmC with PRC-barrel domain